MKKAIVTLGCCALIAPLAFAQHQKQTATIASLHLRKSINRSPLRLAFLLIPLVLVWVARFDHAKAQTSYRVPTSDPRLNLFQDITESQARSRAQAGVSGSLGSSNPPPEGYQQMLQRYKAQAEASEYHPPLAMLHFPITATDFPPTAERLLPTKYAREIPGLTPKQRAGAVADFNQFLDVFEGVGRKNNVASSFAFLASVSLAVVNRLPVLDSNTWGMLTSYYNNGLANDPQFVTMAPRDKQFLYESNIINAGRIDYYAAHGSEQEQRQAREVAWAIVKSLPELDRR